VRRSIEGACPGAVRDLHIDLPSANHVTVRLKVATEAQGNQAAQHILQLPELMPYQVDLQVEVNP
jgi:hypothetical protein